jgi:hypothetical protein
LKAAMKRSRGTINDSSTRWIERKEEEKGQRQHARSEVSVCVCSK